MYYSICKYMINMANKWVRHSIVHALHNVTGLKCHNNYVEFV